MNYSFETITKTNGEKDATWKSENITKRRDEVVVVVEYSTIQFNFAHN